MYVRRITTLREVWSGGGRPLVASSALHTMFLIGFLNCSKFHTLRVPVVCPTADELTTLTEVIQRSRVGTGGSMGVKTMHLPHPMHCWWILPPFRSTL